MRSGIEVAAAEQAVDLGFGFGPVGYFATRRKPMPLGNVIGSDLDVMITLSGQNRRRLLPAPGLGGRFGGRRGLGWCSGFLGGRSGLGPAPLPQA